MFVIHSPSALLRSATSAFAVTAGLAVLASSTLVGFAGPAAAAEAKVNLGTAAGYSVLGASAVTNTGPSVLAEDVGLAPGSSLTGFPPGIVLGTAHINDSQASLAQSALITGYNDAASRASNATVAGDLGGQTLVGGVYTSATTLGLTGTLTLDAQGNRDTVFIFQVGSTLTTAGASRVTLLNDAQACNVYWQVGSSATLGTASSFVGTIMALTSVTATTGATIEGRALARTGAVTLDTNTFTTPGCLAQPVVAATTTTAAVGGTGGTDTTTTIDATGGDGTGSGAGNGSGDSADGTPEDGTPDDGSGTGRLAQTGPRPWTGTLLVVGGLTALAGSGLLADARRRTRRSLTR